METQLRHDVLEFAKLMSTAMNSKQVERETRNEPNYRDISYTLNDALNCLEDKTEQLAFNVKQRPDSELTLKTAVHLANFCMIIAAKCTLGHKLNA